MIVKDYLVVYGHNVQRNQPCYKETEIECNELTKYMPIIKKIQSNINNTENWTGGRTIERLDDGTYIEHNNLYDMYPEFDPKTLDEFRNYLPIDITHIKSIKIFSGEKINII